MPGGGESPAAGALLERAEGGSRSWRAWRTALPRITCEAQAVREARSYLLTDRGLPRPQVTTRGYWRVGAANHPDHDSGED